jgi:hypothetical protein
MPAPLAAQHAHLARRARIIPGAGDGSVIKSDAELQRHSQLQERDILDIAPWLAKEGRFSGVTSRPPPTRRRSRDRATRVAPHLAPIIFVGARER